MVLEAKPQTRMIKISQGQMIIHHWKTPSNVKSESLLIAFYHVFTRVQPSERLLILNWRQELREISTLIIFSRILSSRFVIL